MFNKIRRILESFFIDKNQGQRSKHNRLGLSVSIEPDIDPLAYVAMFEPSINPKFWDRK